MSKIPEKPAAPRERQYNDPVKERTGHWRNGARVRPPTKTVKQTGEKQ